MKVTQEMYVRVEEIETYNEEIGDFKTSVLFTGHSTDMCGYPGWIMVGTEKLQVTFELPENFDLRAQKVISVKNQIEKLRAEFQRRITELTAQYSSLLAIEG